MSDPHSPRVDRSASVPEDGAPSVADAFEPVLEAEALRVQGVAATLGGTPIVLELGFGRAELIMDLAEAAPERRFLGVEVSRKRVVKAGRRVQRRGLRNVWLVHATAEYVLERALEPDCVEECWINCPDPWPKKRHARRRLVQPPLFELLGRVLRPGAVAHLCTDDPRYAEQMAEVSAGAKGFVNLHAPAPFSRERPDRPPTAYELEWLAEGRTMAYFELRREP